MTTLKKNNMYDLSLIMLMSDNGGFICYDVGDSSKCSDANNYPLGAGKGAPFEGGLRSRALLSGTWYYIKFACSAATELLIM